LRYWAERESLVSPKLNKVGRPSSPTDDTVRKALEGLAQLPDWLAAVTQPDKVRAALLRDVTELAAGNIILVDLGPGRLRAKGGRWLARYGLTVSARGGTDQHPFVLAGELLPPATQAVAQEERRVPFGEPGWHGFLTDLRLRLHVQGIDEALPGLPQLLDPESARALLERCLHEGGYHRAAVAACTPNVARYHPGGRCTIVYRLSYSGSADGLPNQVVIKIYRADKGRSAYEAMVALRHTSLVSGDIVTLAEPLAYLSELKAVAQGPVPEEQTLGDLARGALTRGTKAAVDDLRTEMGKTADGLAALHGSNALNGPAYIWGDGLSEVRELVARLALTLPTVALAADPLIASLSALADEMPADQAVTSHGSFRPAQVLLSRGRIGFIDFDGSCFAEPAFDIGRFLASFRDAGISAPAVGGGELAGRAVDDRLALLDQLCEEFLDRYRQQAPVSKDRVLLWEASELLTGVLHTWSKVRPTRVQPRLSLLDHHLDSLRSFAVGVR
jgi:Phosphotransferase enzyme family